MLHVDFKLSFRPMINVESKCRFCLQFAHDMVPPACFRINYNLQCLTYNVRSMVQLQVNYMQSLCSALFNCDDLQMDVQMACNDLQQKLQHAEYFTCDPLISQPVHQILNGFHCYSHNIIAFPMTAYNTMRQL